MKRRWVSTILAVVMGLSCISCSGGGATDSAAAGSTSNTNQPTEEYVADNSVARIALAKNVDILDGIECNSATFTMVYEIFDTLVKLEEDGSVSPCLATSWEQVDDYTWHLTLREGVTFSNGEPFNAESAVYTLNYLVNKTPTYKYSSKWASAWPYTVEADGEYAITITTAEPCLETMALLSRIAMWPTGSAEPGVYEEFIKNPVGTGPYMLESWTLDENITLVANPDYWGEPVKIQRLSYDIITDTSARSVAVQSGEYDLVLGLNYDDAAALEAGSITGMELLQVESTGMQYLFFNGRSENPFIQDPEFRKAMTYAIDYEGILSQLLLGYCDGAQGIAPIVENINNTYAGEGYPEYDPEKAMELAEACGYNGEEISLYYASGQFTNDMEITELIVSLLNAAGFNVVMQEVDAASWSTIRPTSEYDIALNSTSGPATGQPTDLITQVLGVSAGWSWDDVNELVSQCYAEGITDEKFSEYIIEAQRLCWERTPYLWAAEQTLLYAVDPHLKGMETLATGYVRLENAYFE